LYCLPIEAEGAAKRFETDFLTFENPFKPHLLQLAPLLQWLFAPFCARREIERVSHESQG
jgi:hypothetical protein